MGAAQKFGSRDKQYGDVRGTAALDENTAEPGTSCRLQFGPLRGALKKATRSVGGKEESA